MRVKSADIYYNPAANKIDFEESNDVFYSGFDESWIRVGNVRLLPFMDEQAYYINMEDLLQLQRNSKYSMEIFAEFVEQWPLVLPYFDYWKSIKDDV